MPRERIPLGAWGEIRAKAYTVDGKKASGQDKWRSLTDEENVEDFDQIKYRAVARFRGPDGRTRTVEAWGKSKNAARRKLITRLPKLVINNGMYDKQEPLERTIEHWWEHFQKNGGVRQQTLDQYREMIDRFLVPSFGGYKLQEITPGLATTKLNEIAEVGPSNAKRSRIVLKHLYTWAIRADLVKDNPILATPTYSSKAAPAKAASDDTLRKVRQAVKAWLSEKHPGPPRDPVVLDILDFMLATGCRTGEALAVRDVDLELGENPTVTFAGTIVSPRGKGSPYRQDFTKTEAGFRIVELPASTALMVQRRLSENVPGELGLVFANQIGGIFSDHNFRTRLRAALKAADLEGFIPYLLRKTGATEVARTQGLEDASGLLGHTSTAVTKKHYVERDVHAPSTAKTLGDLVDRVSK